MKKCPKCGEIYQDYADFCPKCNSSLDAKIETKDNEAIATTDNKSTAKLPSSDLGLIITLGVILLLICFAVIWAANSGQSTTNSSKSYSSTGKKKMPSIVEWGPLGDTDKEAEETLNRFFDDYEY